MTEENLQQRIRSYTPRETEKKSLGWKAWVPFYGAYLGLKHKGPIVPGDREKDALWGTYHTAIITCSFILATTKSQEIFEFYSDLVQKLF